MNLQSGATSINQVCNELVVKPTVRKTVPEEKYLALLEEFRGAKDAFDEAGLIYDEMNRIVQSNDHFKAYETEVKNLRTLNKQFQSRINGLIAENQAAIKQVKSLEYVIKKIEGK